MPPAAATECERTGWTLETTATEAPASAAASGARWPGSPAPRTRTSYARARGGPPTPPACETAAAPSRRAGDRLAQRGDRRVELVVGQVRRGAEAQDVAAAV